MRKTMLATSQCSGLEGDFFESLDEVTMKRAMKIQTSLQQDHKRIKNFKELASKTATGKMTRTGGIPKSDHPTKMNEFVHA